MGRRIFIGFFIFMMCVLSAGPAMAANVIEVTAINKASGKQMPTLIPEVAVEKSPVLDPSMVSLAGTIQDANNAEPIRNALVSIYLQADPNQLLTQVSTDHNGAYVVANLDPNTYLIKVAASGYRETSRTTTVVEGQQTSLNIFLIPVSSSKGSIFGTVTYAGSNLPVEGAQVTVYLAANPSIAVAQATTGSDGTYYFANLEPDSYEVFVHTVGCYDQYVTTSVTSGATVFEDFALTVSPLHSVVFTDYEHIAQRTEEGPPAPGYLPENMDTLYNNTMSALFIYTPWKYMSGYHKETILLFDSEGSEWNQYWIEFNMDTQWLRTHGVDRLLIPVPGSDPALYPAYHYMGFGGGGWENRFPGTWRAEVYLDAPSSRVWDPNLVKFVWVGEGDTTCHGIGYFNFVTQ